MRTDLQILHLDPKRVGMMPQQAQIKIGYPAATAGIQKAMQAFVTLLLTPRGTAWNMDAGSDFIALLRSGALRSPVDAINAFNSEVGRLLQLVNTGADDDDEILTSVTLDHVMIQHDRVVLKLTFANKSQNTAYISTAV